MPCFMNVQDDANPRIINVDLILSIEPWAVGDEIKGTTVRLCAPSADEARAYRITTSLPFSAFMRRLQFETITVPGRVPLPPPPLPPVATGGA